MSLSPLTSVSAAVDFPSTAPPAAVARQVEGLFASLLLKEMRGDSEEGGLFGGDSSDVLGGMFDQYMGQAIADAGGLGLRDYLVAQARTPTAPPPLPKPCDPRQPLWRWTMRQPHPPPVSSPRSPESAVALVSECREYLNWEEQRLSSILKCLRDSPVDGAALPFEAATDGDAWDPGPGIIRRERLKELIAVVCGIKPSQSGLTILMGRLPPQAAASLQERRDTVRGLAQAVHSATRGWMRQVALLELGVECTLQELTGGRRLSVSYDDHGQMSTGSLQPIISFRT